jgi:hypothetical protein
MCNQLPKKKIKQNYQPNHSSFHASESLKPGAEYLFSFLESIARKHRMRARKVVTELEINYLAKKTLQMIGK